MSRRRGATRAAAGRGLDEVAALATAFNQMATTCTA
jgi:hypothetical protein